jgi:polyhydroxybutyrate depolymerase
MSDTLDCRVWNACAPGTELEFCLHDGGHGVPPGWAEATLDWFEASAD